jgi:hypothetical protein
MRDRVATVRDEVSGSVERERARTPSGDRCRRVKWDTHAVDIPDVHYARAGGVAIAYQVVGDGPRTLVISPLLSDLQSLWVAPYLPRQRRA